MLVLLICMLTYVLAICTRMTRLYFSSKSINKLQECTQKCVSAIKDNNRLVINASKSSIMVVTTKQCVAFNNLLNIDVYLGADHLDQSNCIDYLGVKLDDHLTWNSQIGAVCKKLVFAVFRLGRLRNVIAPNIMLRIYQCIINLDLIMQLLYGESLCN